MGEAKKMLKRTYIHINMYKHDQDGGEEKKDRKMIHTYRYINLYVYIRTHLK